MSPYGHRPPDDGFRQLSAGWSPGPLRQRGSLSAGAASQAACAPTQSGHGTIRKAILPCSRTIARSSRVPSHRRQTRAVVGSAATVGRLGGRMDLVQQTIAGGVKFPVVPARVPLAGGSRAYRGGVAAGGGARGGSPLLGAADDQ